MRNSTRVKSISDIKANAAEVLDRLKKRPHTPVDHPERQGLRHAAGREKL